MNKNIIVKKPDELVHFRGEFGESELKLSTYLVSLLEENKSIYEIDVKEYLKKFDKNLKDYDYLYNVCLNLTKKQLIIKDRFKKRFEIYNFLSGVKYDKGVLMVEFSQMLMEYLIQIKKNYLKYEIKNIMVLGSKYSIRLYEILKNKYEKTKKFQKDIFLKIKVDELRELLAVPLSYKYNMFKRRVIEKAQEEINEKTDIVFSFEEKKKGRKVDEIIFIIKSKYPNKKENKQIKTNFKQFRQDILSKAQDKIIVYNDITFKIKDGLLVRDDKILNKEDAWDWWHIFYKNRDKLKILDKEEIKKMEAEKADEFKKIYKKIKELKERYKYLIVNYMGKDTEATLGDIQIDENDNKFKVFINIDSHTQIMKFDNLNKVERFLKICNDAYKKAKM
jgi:plasmid replication initiation protein